MICIEIRANIISYNKNISFTIMIKGGRSNMKKMIQTVLLQLISLVLLTIANPATASEWPMFRANPLRTGTIETKNANSKVTLSGEKDWS